MSNFGTGNVQDELNRCMPAARDAKLGDVLNDLLNAVNGIGGTVVAVTMTAAGTGYTSAPTVAFTGGGGSGATGVAILSGTTVAAVVITNPGSGYTSAPTVGFSGGAGSGAAATAVVSSAHALLGLNNRS
jgi:hypothetical protein